METVEQRSPVQYSPRRQSMWVLADYGVPRGMIDNAKSGGWISTRFSVDSSKDGEGAVRLTNRITLFRLLCPVRSICKYIYTMFHTKTTTYLIAHNFGKC